MYQSNPTTKTTKTNNKAVHMFRTQTSPLNSNKQQYIATVNINMNKAKNKTKNVFIIKMIQYAFSNTYLYVATERQNTRDVLFFYVNSLCVIDSKQFNGFSFGYVCIIP